MKLTNEMYRVNLIRSVPSISAGIVIGSFFAAFLYGIKLILLYYIESCISAECPAESAGRPVSGAFLPCVKATGV